MRIVIFFAIIFAWLGIASAQQKESSTAGSRSNAEVLPQTAPGVTDGDLRRPVRTFRYSVVVTGELKGKLDSRTATVGQTVFVRVSTTGYAQDGSTVMPEGTILVGKVEAVRRETSTHAGSSIEISLDHAVCKHGPDVDALTVLYPLPHPGLGSTMPYSGGTVDWIFEHDAPLPENGFSHPVVPSRGGTSYRFARSYIPEASGIKGIWLENVPFGMSGGIFLVPKGHVRLGAGSPMHMSVYLVSRVNCQ